MVFAPGIDAIIRAVAGLGLRLWGAEDQVRRCRDVSLPLAAGRGDCVDSYFPRVGDSVSELYVLDPATSKPPPPPTVITTAHEKFLGSLLEQPLSRDQASASSDSTQTVNP